MKIRATDVTRCQHCGHKHAALTVHTLAYGATVRGQRWTHVASCPESFKPVYIRFDDARGNGPHFAYVDEPVPAA